MVEVEPVRALASEIFRFASNGNSGGVLSQAAFCSLLSVVNPESKLSEEALELVAQQVWYEYQEYTCTEGLDEAGFVEIYVRGEADARRDVEFVRRALEARQKKARGHVDRSLSFVVHVRGLNGGRGGAVKDGVCTRVSVQRALEGALPDGMKGRVVVDESVETYPGGQAFGVSCMYRGEDVGRDEFAYFKGVLELEPSQVFAERVFGEDVVVSMFREDALRSEKKGDGGEESQARDETVNREIAAYRRVSVGVMRAAELMGAVGQSSMAFAVLDGQGDGGAGLMEVLADGLPKGAAAVICKDLGLNRVDGEDGGMSCVDGARIVTIAVRVPTERVRVAQKTIDSVVRRSSAMEVFRERRPVVMCTLTLHDHWQSDASRFVDDMASILPTGSKVGLLSDGSHGHGSMNRVQMLAALPKDSTQREVEIYQEQIACESGLEDWCRAAGEVRRVEVSDGMRALSLTSDDSVDANGDLFVPDHARIVPLDESNDQDAIMSPVVAGYERRSPSESGSSGLVEALANTQIEETSARGEIAGQMVGAKSDNDAVEERMGSKKSSDGPQPRVIAVTSYVPGPSETPEPALRIKTGGGWKGFLKSLSPKKKSRAERARAEEDAKETVGEGVEDIGRKDATSSATSKDKVNVLQPPMASMDHDNAGGSTAESREQAVMKANIAQIVGQVEYAVSLLSAPSPSTGGRRNDAIAGKAKGAMSNIESALHAALLMPSWACSAACMKSAEVLLKAGLFEEARKFLVGATQATPEDPLAYFRLGYTYFGLNDFESAARHFYEAIKRCTQHDGDLLVKIHINMGIALESMGNLTTAEREYYKAAALDEEHPRVHKLLGSVRYALGNYEGAAIALERALKNVPDFADAWTDLGCVRRALGNSKDAARCFKMALASEPDNLEAHYNMGVLMRESFEPKEAIHHYDCVLDQDPKHSLALLGKAVALSMLADAAKSKELAGMHRKDAAVCLRKFLELCDPEDPLAIEVQKIHDMIRANTPAKQISNQLSLLIEDVEASQRMASTPGGGAVSPRSPVKTPAAPTSQESRDMNRVKEVVRDDPFREQEVDSKLGNVGEKVVIRRSQSHASQASHSSWSRSHSQSLSRSISRTASAAMEKHPTDRSYDRLCRWHPPTRVQEHDFADEVCKVMDLALDREKSAQHILSKLDVPLLQTLQPLTCLTFDALMTATFSTRSGQTSPTKMVRNKCVREIHFHEFLEMILYLVRSRAPEHLVRGALMTLEHRVLPILDVSRTQHVNFPIIMAMMAMLVDAPGRDRLNYAYRLLMARTANSSSGESLATKSDVVELMASLMAVFGLEHKRNVLESAVSASVRNSAVIMTEKFAEDMEKYWPEYEVLPLLANPLR